MAEPLTDQKVALRAAARAVLRSLTPEQKTSAAVMICDRLASLTIWQGAQSILLFSPRADEPDIWPLAELALQQGKMVALPRFAADSGTYEAAQISKPVADILPGRFGILEPAPACAAADLKRLDLIVVPALAFDRHGHRLGRGKGFYDRLLAALPGTTCGVAFDPQLVEAIPVEPHDIRLNCIFNTVALDHALIRARLVNVFGNKYFEGAGGFVLGAGVVYLLLWWRGRRLMSAHRKQAEDLVSNARRDAGDITAQARLAANEEAFKLRRDIEDALSAQRLQQTEREHRLTEREGLINSQLERVMKAERVMDEREESVRKQAAALETQQHELTALTVQRREQLQTLSGITMTEARQQFLKEIETETLHDASKLSRHIIEEARARAEEKARQIISTAIQRYASEHTCETTTATIALQDVELKGRIIGREGRNIRAFEAATGVTVLIDDTPNAVVLSSFDPVRREIAKEAMQRLIQDGRIHPTRIEEVVAKVTQEIDDSIVDLGEGAVLKAGLPPLHADIVKLLGRLHFRRSYSQNILDHSVEVAQLMGLMAHELGVDVTLARRAGLLHDIGKALNHEVEGPHAIVGADFARRNGEPEPVVNAIASHHNDVEPIGPLGILVSAADAISASRPGARSENMATYLKRVEDLEHLGMSFPGVEKCYAVQAGRELRVFVHPHETSDDQAFALARSIAHKIEGELQYPGQIKITVIRETRCVEVAK